MRHMSRLAVGIVLCVGWVAVPSASGSTVSNGPIAFSTHFVLPFGDRGVGAQIFTVPPNGGASHQLTHVSSDQDAAAPAWSPSGARIVYESDVTGDMQIYSPDGSRIVFARCDSSLFYCRIATISAAGGSLHVLTRGHWVDADPTFSPSGRWIAFDSSRGGYQSAVWVMTAGGQKLQRLTAPGLEAFWPSWSPDGTHIAFTRDCCLPFSQVFVMDSNGTNVLQLTHVPLPHQAGFASYSPDGQKLVLISDLAYPNEDGNDIYTVNASTGQGLTRVTRTQPGTTLSSWGPQR